MLAIQKSGEFAGRKTLLTIVALLMVAGGLYLLVLVSAPAVIPFVAKPIEPASLAKPVIGEDRIIIPKIGVNIAYEANEAALDSGAWWRYPERGNPEDGGNFIISAHRFTLWSTVQKTIEKSPFYNIDKLATDDQIVIDYSGKRYLYTINRVFDVKPSQTEIEAPSTEAKLTLYTCTLGGSADGRVVLTATPQGEVDTTQLASDNPNQP